MYLLLISAAGDLCVLKDFLGNPVNPLQLRRRFPDPPLNANKGSGSVWGKLRGGEGWPGRSPGLVVGGSFLREVPQPGTGAGGAGVDAGLMLLWFL